MVNDPIGDMLAQIKNATMAGKRMVGLPHSRLKQAVAEILSSGVRDIDFVARYGGEEFAIIFTGADKRQAAEAADQLRKRLESEKFSFNGKHSGGTASFGAAQFPSDGATSSQLVRAADERLYKAKEAGRNRVVYE